MTAGTGPGQMTGGAPGQQLRRSQAQRRAETRKRLLDAVVESISEVGYAATTNRHVTERAGLSPGAQTHHFPRRLDLITAAVEYLADRRCEWLRTAARQMPRPRGQRIEAGLDLIWQEFSHPLFSVMVKLWVAAADDPELYAVLIAVERRLARNIRIVARDLMGAVADQPDFDDRMTVVLSTVRGLALAERFEPAAREQAAAAWPVHRAFLARMLAN